MISLKFSCIAPATDRLAPAMLAALLLLAGCAPTAPRPEAVADEAAQAAREAQLAGQPDWGFRGRVALSQGSNGGNAGIRWRQHGADYDIELSAPITRQSWRLQARGTQVTLAGLEGGTRQGADAEALLLEATGWRIPVAAMSAWARGARAPGTAVLASDPQGRPATLQQQGWTIEYRAWLPGGDPALPQKVFARQGDASVRLVVEAWDPP